MKTHRFKLAEWLPQESDGSIYIDWPAVHRQAGIDRIQWLKSQDPLECQLMVEAKQCSAHNSLVAEIYSDKLAIAYHLMWAK
jgi:hypothetical protein